MTDNIESKHDTADSNAGGVPMFAIILFIAFILHILCFLIGGIMVDKALGHSVPLVGVVLMGLAFTFAKALNARMPSGMGKFHTLMIVGILGHLLLLASAGLLRCDTVWLLSDTCIAQFETPVGELR